MTWEWRLKNHVLVLKSKKISMIPKDHLEIWMIKHTPLWNVPYEKQLEQKQNVMASILMQYRKKVILWCFDDHLRSYPRPWAH